MALLFSSIVALTKKQAVHTEIPNLHTKQLQHRLAGAVSSVSTLVSLCLGNALRVFHSSDHEGYPHTLLCWCGAHKDLPTSASV